MMQLRISADCLRVWAARPGWTILAVTVLISCVHFGGMSVRGLRPRLVRGDAVHYYVYLRSLTFDRDLDFENDYTGLYRLDSQDPAAPTLDWSEYRTPTGLVRNYMAMGTALFSVPLFALVTVVGFALSAAGLAVAPDGFGLAHQMVPGASGLVACGFALWLAFLLGRDVFRTGPALWGVFGALAGTSLLYYALVAPSYSHSVSALAVSGFLVAWWRMRDGDSVKRYVVLGLLVGLAALVRWQDALLLAILGIDAIVHAFRRQCALWNRVFHASVCGLAAVAAASVAFAPQLIAWKVLYGQFLLVPQGGNFMRWAAPQVAEVLFSPFRGLFAWTPLAAIGIAGLVPLWRRDRRLTIALSVFFAGSLYANAAVADWWAGEAFGARRFVSCFPLFAVGLAAWVQGPWPQRRIVITAVAILCVSNFFLLFYYQMYMLGYTNLVDYPDNWYTLWVDRFALPFRLVWRFCT